MKLDQKHFQKKHFSGDDLAKLAANCKRDLDIAKKSDVPEVVFKFSYDAFLKGCIALVAAEGYRPNSKLRHHRAVISAARRVLGSKFRDRIIYCDTMRKKRNLDLYGGGVIVSLSESRQFLKVVSEIFEEIEKRLLAGQ